MVFLLSCLITGVLEYLTGLVLYEVYNIRLWDYNTEIWNFGNINGYICLRSILFFGLSSMLLIYIILPIIKKIALKFNSKLFDILCILIGMIFALDIILYRILK